MDGSMKTNWPRLILIMLVIFLALNFFSYFSGSNSMNISYTQFRKYVEEDKVASITVKKDEIHGVFKKEQASNKPKNKQKYKDFSTVLPSFGDQHLLQLLTEKKVVITAEPEGRSWLSTLLIMLLPWILIIGFFVYSSKRIRERMGGIGGNLFNFAKSKAKLYTKTTSSITYSDVADLANAKNELEEIVDFLKNPERYRAIGGTLPKGVLLVGPPGTGKTLLAQASAGEADVPFFSISGSEFIEMFVGVGASRVRDMFETAKKDAPSIIFIDEIDSIGRVRGTGLGGGHDEREQTLNQILSEMDGFSPSQSVVVMAATNRPDVLDPALVRPGRFDRQITLDLPQQKARKQILEIHARKVALADDVDFDTLASATVGFSGADLRNLVNEAALLTAREEKEHVEMVDFDQSLDKVRMGLKREDLINEKEKEMIAYHEAGHALVAKLIPGADPLQKVTIIPRGHSLGATQQLPEEDKHNFPRRYLIDRLAIMLGGRAAEKIIYKDITSGGSDDLKKASQLARQMICQWGMSDKLGAVAFRMGEQHPFLGREIAEPKDFSEHTAQIIDDEIRELIRSMEERAEKLLGENRSKLESIAHALLKHETLSNEEVNKILQENQEEQEGGEQANR
jgi:cell division protease FtsH